MTKLEFTDQEMQLLQAAILELPYKLAVPLIASINKQIAEQRKEPVPEEHD